MRNEISIYEHFKAIPDPRIERGKKHLLEDIIFIAIVSIICGADDWNEIEMFADLKIDWFRKFSPLKNGIPSHDTFNRVFSLLDPKKICRVNDRTIQFKHPGRFRFNFDRWKSSKAFGR